MLCALEIKMDRYHAIDITPEDGNESGWFQSILNLIDQNGPRSESIRQLIDTRVIQPIAQSALRLMFPYFASLIILLTITVILLAVVLYYMVNHSGLGTSMPFVNDGPVQMTFLDFTEAN